MKTLFVAVVTLFFAFFLGCESSVTDPEVLETTKFIGSSEQENSTYKDVFNFTYPNVIKLSGSLYDPSHRLNSFAEIEGVVRYGIKELNNGTAAEIPIDFYKVGLPGTPDKNKKIDIYVDATLKSNCPFSHRAWTVKKSADQIINVNTVNQVVTYIQKSFRLKNTCCAVLDLVLKFELYEERDLKLVSMELSLVPGQQPIINQE